MFEELALWFREEAAGQFLLTMLISMIPVAELRVGVPAGVAMGLPIPVALLAGIIGNMLPVPFVILFIRNVFQWIRVHIPRLERLISRMEGRAYAKAKSAGVVRFQEWGLLLFVAIPFPGTGAWTGSVVAALMDLRLRNAVPVIFLGVVIAGLVMTALSYGVTALL